jgi:hypothetical protein
MPSPDVADQGRPAQITSGLRSTSNIAKKHTSSELGTASYVQAKQPSGAPWWVAQEKCLHFHRQTTADTASAKHTEQEPHKLEAFFRLLQEQIQTGV